MQVANYTITWMGSMLRNFPISVKLCPMSLLWHVVFLFICFFTSPILSLQNGCWQQRPNGKQSIAADMGEWNARWRGSGDISLISLAVWKAAEVTYFVSGPSHLPFPRCSHFSFQLLRPFPPDLLPPPSCLPCFIPSVWHRSGAMFPRNAAPFRLHWSGWKCFCRKKVTCSDRLWTHRVIMLQSRLSLLRKLQWAGFSSMIMWLQRFGPL